MTTEKLSPKKYKRDSFPNAYNINKNFNDIIEQVKLLSDMREVLRSYKIFCDRDSEEFKKLLPLLKESAIWKNRVLEIIQNFIDKYGNEYIKEENLFELDIHESEESKKFLNRSIFKRTVLYHLIKNDSYFNSSPIIKKILKTTASAVAEEYSSYWTKAKNVKKNPSKFLKKYKGNPKPPKRLKSNSCYKLELPNDTFKRHQKHPKMLWINSFKAEIPDLANSNDISEMTVHPERNGVTFRVVFKKIVTKTSNLSVDYFKKLSKFAKQNLDSLEELNVVGIDIGTTVLATLASNHSHYRGTMIGEGKTSYIVNSYWNNRSKAQSNMPYSQQRDSEGNRVQLSDSNHLHSLLKNYENRKSTHMHTASKQCADWCKFAKAELVLIGKTNNWKSRIKLHGKYATRNHASIPHNQFIDLLIYKLNERGIPAIIVNESFTSISSFLDRDYVSYRNPKKYQKPKGTSQKELFSGKRFPRGIYTSRSGIKMHSDYKAALSIIEKSIGSHYIEDDRYNYSKQNPVKLPLLTPIKKLFNPLNQESKKFYGSSAYGRVSEYN